MKYKKGTNLEDVQEMNRSLVIRLLRNMQICSRAELAKETGLKQATITNIINDLMDWGLVIETGIIEGKKGRRSIGITLNAEMYKVIGVRLTRKYFSVGLFDIAGTEYCVKSEPIDMVSGSSKALEKMKQLIGKILFTIGKENILSIGVATPGPFFKNEGRIALMTEFPGWDKIFLQDELQTAFGLPVYLEHDANAGVLAEWWLGSNKMDSGTMVYVAAGQGIGAGIIIDGKVFRGALGIAGEIGHMSIAYDGPKCECGNYGCLYQYCSTTALLREVREKLPQYPWSILNSDSSLKSIFKALERKDELAVKVFNKIAEFLGIGLANVVNVYNPNIIIIGDELIQAGPLLLEIVRESVRKHILPSVYKNLQIELSSFQNDPVLVGAGALAADKILRKPSVSLKLAKYQRAD